MLNFVHHNKFFIEYQQKNEDEFPNTGTSLFRGFWDFVGEWGESEKVSGELWSG
jgi:hypothetical protein